jgi:uncharacterized protein (DUF488 family)
MINPLPKNPPPLCMALSPHPNYASPVAPRIFTIGHSNRALPAFVAMLTEHRVARVADVRRVPASRRHPHFGRAELERGLRAAGIDYLWLPGLGGMRESTRAGSPHTALVDPVWRAYADHMDSAEFANAFAALTAAASDAPTAFMCAEAAPASCHRRFIADALLAAGWEVVHIVGPVSLEPHALPDAARIDAGRVVYDRGQRTLF